MPKFDANAIENILRGAPGVIVRITPAGRKFIESMKKIAKGPHVAVGITQEKFDLEKESGPGEKSNYTLGEVGVVHEFGSKDGTIPERSYLRVPAQEKQKEMLGYIDELRSQVVTNKMTVQTALGRIGMKFESIVRDRIRSNIPPRLKDETIDRKTRDGKTGEIALIDWGQLIQSISSQVNMHGNR